MSNSKELSYKMLRKECEPKLFKFKDTSELEPVYDVIGQERALRAMEFGLRINKRGYNIYMSGMSGTGKTSYAQKYIREMAKEGKVPDDWCYVYNFNKPNEPLAVNLPAGKGKIFQKDMDEFIKVLQYEISKAFDSEDYERERAKLIQEFNAKRNKLLEKLNDDAEKQGFKVKTTNTGIYFIPVIEGKTISEEEYSELEEKVKNEIDEKSNTVQLDTMEVIRKIKNIEREAEEKVAEWEHKIALFAVGMNINDLKEKYKDNEKISNYLDKLQEDILENVNDFKEEEISEEATAMMMPFMRKSEGSPADKYKVNLLVDNSEVKGSPLVVDYNPSYYNLVGKLEYENEFGSVTTDFTMIKGGLFHQANGGYLIIQAKDILANAQSWEALKRAIRTKQITIENMKEQMGLVALSTLKPEPIPLDIKVVLVGNEHLYQMLYEYDEDFKKLFKIKVDFDREMDRNPENIYRLAQFIASFCIRENTMHFHKTGVAKVIEYSSRLVDDQNKLSTKFNDIVEILCESTTWAEIDKSSLVESKHVKKAIEEKIYRSNKYDKKLLEKIEDGTIMIDTEGEVIGQINGLTILDMGDYAFGKPARITATTFMGESGIVNIEREIEMSGTSHSKGILILGGYIGQKYAQDMPLSLAANLCFEQLYNGVDGDSASSAELYALLSSLAEVPINQGIAVTGSVNQKGEIQPIGGATEKIEGFYELCKIRELNGKQGVIIPHQNIRNLVLCDEIVESVKKGEFHIYSIKTIDEGIEILTGEKAGTRLKNGSFPKGSINHKVYEKLKYFAQVSSDFSKEEKGVKNIKGKNIKN